MHLIWPGRRHRRDDLNGHGGNHRGGVVSEAWEVLRRWGQRTVADQEMSQRKRVLERTKKIAVLGTEMASRQTNANSHKHKRKILIFLLARLYPCRRRIFWHSHGNSAR